MSTNSYQTRDESQLRVAIGDDEFYVVPGNEVDIQVSVINAGSEADEIDIRVSGIPAGWIISDIPFVHVAPGETRQITLTIHLPLVPESRVGQYPMRIHAVSQNDPNRSAA